MLNRSFRDTLEIYYGNNEICPPPQQQCDICNKKCPGKNLKQCRKCHLAFYCTSCQPGQWKNHKKICQRICTLKKENEKQQFHALFISNLQEKEKNEKEIYCKFQEELAKQEQRINTYQEELHTLRTKLLQKEKLLTQLFDKQEKNNELEKKIKKYKNIVVTYQNQLIDQNNEIYVKQKSPDNSSLAFAEVTLQLSRPTFYKELLQLWYYCTEGNCHLLTDHNCSLEICSMEAQQILNSKLTDEKGKTSNNFQLFYNGAYYQIIKGEEPYWIQIRQSTGNRRYLWQNFLFISPVYWDRCAKANYPYTLEATLDLKKNLRPFMGSWFDKVDILFVETIFNAKQYFQFDIDYHLKVKRYQALDFKQSFPQIIPAFHGTSTSFIPSIVENGLHFYYSNRGCYSRGIYVSVSAEVCDKHYCKSKPDEKETRQMLFCLVNIGNPTLVENANGINQDRPCEQNGQLLDSVAFIHAGAQAFVVPSSSQIYPLAVLTYRYKKNTSLKE